MRQLEAVMAVRKIFGEKADVEWGEGWVAKNDTLRITCKVTCDDRKIGPFHIVCFDREGGVHREPREARKLLVATLQAEHDDIVDSLSCHPVPESQAPPAGADGPSDGS